MKPLYLVMSYNSDDSSERSLGSPDDILERIIERPEINRIANVMSARHRRLILLSLNHGSVETQEDVVLRSGSDKEVTETQLVHNHLPKLEEAGYITWDRETGEISEGPDFDEIEPILELLENHADELPPDWP